MKNGKKMFILIEIILAVIVIMLASAMLQEKGGKEVDKVSVIIQNSDDNQWAAFKYGLKMAAEDQGIEVFVVSTGAAMTMEEEKSAIEREIENGADAVIVQPVSGSGSEAMLKKIQKKIPVMLVESTVSQDGKTSVLPAAEPDQYAMGVTLAEELLKDYGGNIEGKKIGFVSETYDSEAAMNRKRGVEDTLKDSGVKISWAVSDASANETSNTIMSQPKVDIVIAMDDSSFIKAGECSSSNNLHGALVYGIGNSTEAVYYLDTGIAACLVVPDAFNIGYQSLTEIAENLKYSFRSLQNQKISYTVLRRDTLFLKENQEIIFTMSQ